MVVPIKPTPLKKYMKKAIWNSDLDGLIKTHLQIRKDSVEALLDFLLKLSAFITIKAAASYSSEIERGKGVQLKRKNINDVICKNLLRYISGSQSVDLDSKALQ